MLTSELRRLEKRTDREGKRVLLNSRREETVQRWGRGDAVDQSRHRWPVTLASWADGSFDLPVVHRTPEIQGGALIVRAPKHCRFLVIPGGLLVEERRVGAVGKENTG